MGRSVSYPSDSVVVCYRDVSSFGAVYAEDENGDFDYDDIVDIDEFEARDDFEFFVEDIRESVKSEWPSFYEEDGWIDREDRILLANGHAYVGVSEYCGLASIWLVPRESEHEELSAAWCASIENKFKKLFGELVKVGSFSNGESVYKKVS